MVNYFNIKIILLLPLLLFAKHPKIYDCFPFFNELDILEMRLTEMYDAVDYFVLVECRETFRGNPKPLHFQENKKRYSRFKDKIIHIIVDEEVHTGNPWEREEFQKNQIIRGLKNCSKKDIVIIGDLDEIIRSSDMRRFIEPILSGREKAVSATQRFYRWYLNRRSRELPLWIGSIATTYGELKQSSFYKLREKKDFLPRIEDVGWHFSNMGGLSLYQQKLASFSHSEADTVENRKSRNIFSFIQRELTLEPIDATFPQYIRSRESELYHRGFLDYPGNIQYR